ncbi:uncharacterized protein PG986_007007 [Apiospora aurea]|uniref:Uncharacterized protein n=1 Tax=Apiospora aurea TaxID=335848 RepID=A0ABR1QBB7_9PEZI
MKSSTVAMAVGATAVSADMPGNLTSFTSVYSGDNCIFKRANGDVYTLPADKCTQTESMANILESGSSTAPFTATSGFQAAKTTGASGNGPYTYGASSLAPSGTYILTGNSWTTSFTATGSDNSAWATSVASSAGVTDTTVTSTVRGTVKVTVHRSSAPTGAWSSGTSWDSSAAPTSNSAWASGTSWYNSATPAGTWSSTTSWGTSAAPTSTGAWSSSASWDSSAAPTASSAWSSTTSEDSTAVPTVSSAWSSATESSAAPTGASWDSSSSYGFATVTASSQPSGPAGSYNATWSSSTTAGSTPSGPSDTGAANPTVVPINTGASLKTATKMLAAVAMFAMVAL